MLRKMTDATACCRKYAQCFLNNNEVPSSNHQANTYNSQNNEILNQIYENYKRCLVEREIQSQNTGFYQTWNETSALYTDPKIKLMESSPYYKELLKDLEEETVGTTEYRSPTSFVSTDWPVGNSTEACNPETAANSPTVVPEDRLETLSSSIENLKSEMASKSFMSTSIESLKNEMATKTFVNDTIETLKNEIVANKSYVSSSIDALKIEMAKASASSSAEIENCGSVTSAGEEQLRKVFEELEKQIEMFKIENANLVKAKVLYDTKLLKFEDLKREYEKQLFEKNKAIEEYLAAEKKKLDSEIVKLQNSSLGRNVEFEERVVNQLKEQVASLKEEMRKKEDNFKTSQYQIQQELAKLHQECNNLRSKLYGKGESCKEQVIRQPSVKEEPTNNNRQNVDGAAPKNEIQKELLQAEKILGEIRQKNKAFCALHGLSGQKQCSVHPHGNPSSQYAVSSDRQEAKEDTANRTPSRAQPEKVVKGNNENWQTTNCRLHDMSVIQRTQKLLEEIKQMNDIGVLDNSSELDKLEKASTNTAEKLKILQKCLALLSTAKNLNKTQKNETKEKEIPLVKPTKSPVQQQPLREQPAKPAIPAKPVIKESEKNPNNIYTELQESYQKLLDIVSTSKKNHQDNQEIKPTSVKSHVKNAISANRVASSTDRIPDGNKTVLYSNGSLKIITNNGKREKIVYPNGDILERFVDEGMQKYYHAGKKLWVTKDKTGKKYIEYANGQKERYEPDGSVVVRYTDGSALKTFPDGKVEWSLADGMRLELDVSGDKVLDFPNGQREIHTKDHKRREYPDGTVKYLFPNGTTRTEYANGKVRVKNRNGVIIYNATQAATSTV